MGRTRASLGLVLGVVGVVAALALRAAPLFGATALHTEASVGWIAFVLAFAIALTIVLVRPRPLRLAELLVPGTLLIAGLVVGASAGFEMLHADFVIVGLEGVAAAAIVVAVTRFHRERMVRSLPHHGLDSKRKVKLEREGKKKLVRVPAESLVTGDRIHLEPGEEIPVDAVVVDGSGFVDEREITGVRLPVAKRPRDPLFAGSEAAIPDLVAEARAPQHEAFAINRGRVLEKMAASIGEVTRAENLLFALSILMIAACALAIVWQGSPNWGARMITLLAASATGAASAALLWGRYAQLSRSFSKGLIVARSKDFLALSRIRGVQMDPRVLCSGGEVEVLVFGSSTRQEVLQVSEAVLSEHGGMEFDVLRAARLAAGVHPLGAAALKRVDGLHYATVSSLRWYFGTERVVTEKEQVEITDDVGSAIEFFREKDALVFLLGNTKDGLVAAVGLEFRVDQDVATAARALEASLLPGLPDLVRQSIASVAGLTCDGPPLTKKDASVLEPTADAPSAGLRIRLMPYTVPARVPKEGSPRLVRPALVGLPELLGSLAKIRRRATLLAILIAVLGPATGLLIAAFGWPSPLLSLVIAMLSFSVAGSVQGVAEPPAVADV